MPDSDDQGASRARGESAARGRAGEDQRVPEEPSGREGAPLRVLMVEDSEDDALLLARALRTAGYAPAFERVDTGDALRAALDREVWDVVLVDYVMPQFSPLAALEIIREKGLDLPCILVSGKVTDEIAIEAMKAGAHDFVAKDATARLPPAIERERRAAAARRAARENEARLSAIVETAVDGIITINESAVVEAINPAAGRLLGYAPEEVIGHNVNMLMPEPYHSEHQGYIERYLRTGEARVIGIGRDVRARRKDGTTFPIHLSVSEARPNGRRIFTAILHDESERKAREDALRVAQAQLQIVTDTMAVGVTRCSRDRRYLWANRAYAEWIGRPPEEIAGQAIQAVIGAAAYETILPYIERVLTGQRVEYEAEVDFLEPGRRWINAVYTPTYDTAGAPDGWVAVITDITERKAAEERERYLASFPRLNPNPILETDLAGKVTYANHSALTAFPGISAGGPEHPALAELAEMGERMRREGIATMTREIQFGEAVYNETVHRVPDRPALRVYCLDLTERKRAEDALRDREAEMRLVMDAAPALISYIGADYRYRRANRNYERWFGRTEAEITGRHVREVLGEAAWQAVRPHMARALAGEVVDYEQELPYAGGGARWVHVTYSPDRDASGRVSGFVVHVMDIRERKRAEEHTAALQQITAALLRAQTPTEVGQVITAEAVRATGAAGSALAAWTTDGRALENLATVGYPPEVDVKWRRVPEDTAAPLAEAARTGRAVLLRSAEEWDALYPAVAPENRRLGYGAAASIPLVLGGQVLGAIALSYVGAREFPKDDLALLDAIAGQAAQALERARLYEAERKARVEAEEANQAKDQFVAMISHELRNPLAAITAGLGFLRQAYPAEGRAGRALDIVERNTALQTRLINDLLDLSRLQRGKLQLQRAPVELAKVVTTACRSFAAEADEARLTLTCEPETDLWVYGDRDRLQQVVANLLSNAVKFTPAPGEVSVDVRRLVVSGRVASDATGMGVSRRTRQEWESRVGRDRSGGERAAGSPTPPFAHSPTHGEVARIVVDDTGIGISPELLPDLFEMFRQGEIASQRAAGLGLGLALVKGIVERHGGTAWAESDGIGKGSRFVVELPLIQAPVFRVQGSGSAPLGPEPRTLEPTRVLVVEDNADTRCMLSDSLTLAGYEVHAAANGVEALAIVRDARPDIMLVDIGLPGMDGFEFLRRAREEPGIVDVPAFAVTGYGAEADVRRGREVGFAGHFVKPVNLDNLKERIREWVAAPPAAG